MSETRTVDVLDVKGAKAGTAELPADLFDVPAAKLRERLSLGL